MFPIVSGTCLYAPYTHTPSALKLNGTKIFFVLRSTRTTTAAITQKTAAIARLYTNTVQPVIAVGAKVIEQAVRLKCITIIKDRLPVRSYTHTINIRKGGSWPIKKLRPDRTA